MGMYTEVIVGCTLKKNLPKVCVNALTLISNKQEINENDKET